jgi:hypothetical protein
MGGGYGVGILFLFVCVLDRKDLYFVDMPLLYRGVEQKIKYLLELCHYSVCYYVIICYYVVICIWFNYLLT